MFRNLRLNHSSFSLGLQASRLLRAPQGATILPSTQPPTRCSRYAIAAGETPSEGGKATLLTLLREEPADPTLTLTTEDVQLRVNGDTAIVVGKRIEKRRNPDNNQEGTAYARYTRTYVKRTDKRRPAAELFPESETEFFLKGRDAQVTFVRDRKGQVTHALLRINGAPIRARRVGESDSC